MILSQTDLILRAIQVTSLWATALWEETPRASTVLFAPAEQSRQIQLTRSGRGSGGRSQGATGKGQHVQKNTQRIWHASLQLEILVEAGWSSGHRVPAAPNDPTETRRSSALLKDLWDQGLSKRRDLRIYTETNTLINPLPPLWPKCSNPNQNFIYRNQDNL